MEDKILTKDKRELSLKQELTLLRKFPTYCDNKGFYHYDKDELDEFIATHTYKECSDEIGRLIEYWESKKTHDLDMGDGMPYGMEDSCMMDGW